MHGFRLMLGFLLMVGMMLPAALFAAGEGESSAAVELPEGIELVTPERIGNPNGAITLRWAVQQVYSPFSDIVARTDYLRERLEEWVRANPNVRIEPEVFGGDLAAWHAKVAAQAAAGRAPDAAQVDGPNGAADFRHWLQPLDDYFSQEEIDDWMEWALDSAMIDPADGKLKLLWFTGVTQGLWYRKDLIPNPPRSWDEALEIGKQMQAQGFKYGYMASLKAGYVTWNGVLPYYFSGGNRLVDDAGEPTFGLGENRDRMIEVFSFYRRAMDEGVMPPNDLGSTAGTDMAADMAANNTAMFQTSIILSHLKQAMTEEQLEQWAFTYHPQQDADGPRGQVVGGWSWGFFTDDPEKLELAVSLVDHLYTSKEGMAGWCEAGGYLPVRKSVYEEFPYFSDKWNSVFGMVMDAGRPRPGVPAYSVIDESLQQAFEAMVIGQMTPEEAVDAAWENTLQQLN